MNKKSITILVVCLIVSVMSVSLAFFSARIIGDGKNVSVNAKELTINFDNNNEIASGIIEPGWSSTNTFSVENKSKASFTYDIVLKNYKNTTKTNGYLVYKITSTNGYNMTEYKDMPKDGENTYDLVIARGITIEPGSSNKQSYTLEIKYLNSTEDQSIDMGSTVTGSLYIVESTTNENNPYTKGTLGYQIMEDNSNIKTRTDFSKTYTDINIGTMYKAKEENIDVYYFAGDARNNWVKLGGYYWRIIRTNSDGSIRLLYAGTSPDTTEAYIGTSAFNETYEDPIYAGYMYGTSGSLDLNRTNENNSTIKTYIDNWYNNNLSSYTKYISTEAVYCNDREVKKGNYSLSGPMFEFGSSIRIDTNNQPTYDCANKKDAFSGSNTEAKLLYPIALMTADEVTYAGGRHNGCIDGLLTTWYSLNSKKEGATGTTWWFLLSPAVAERAAYNFHMYPEGCLGVYSSVENIWGVRPVISLKSDVVYKLGNGSASSPYTIEEVADPKLTDVIKTNAVNENGYRYEGTNPNNYIYMTNKSTNEKELWRIIGVFNDGANGEEVIRVRRHYEKDSYPTMAYDSNKTNHFPNTTMHNKLSSTYNLTNYSHTVNYKMYLGTSSSYSSLTSSAWFEAERGSTPGVTAKNNYNSSTSFIGSVGLIYPSDYGYAVLASDCPRTKETNSYHNLAACHNNNWLYQGDGIYQWLLSPSSSYANGAYYVDYRGLTNNDLLSATDDVPHFTGVQNLFPTIPVMALSADVTVSGSGTQSDPYVMTN